MRPDLGAWPSVLTAGGPPAGAFPSNVLRAFVDAAYNPAPMSDYQFGEKFLPLIGPKWYRHYAFYGGRGGAKSQHIAKALALITNVKEKRVVCARQFQSSLRESSKEIIERKIASLGLSNNYRSTETDIVHKHTGSRFIFIGLDRNPHAVKSLEGADICWVEEASAISKTSLSILIPTVRAIGSSFIWSWNPDQPEDPVDEYFRGPVTPPDSYICEVTYNDNPFFYMSELPQEMEFQKSKNFKEYEHIWLGHYDSTYTGRVFTNVSVGRVEIGPNDFPLYGLDFGFGSDPSSIVRIYVLWERGVVYVAGEKTGVVDLKDLPALLDCVVEDRDDLITADSSQPQTIGYLRDAGFNIVGAVKAPGSVKTGIGWLRGFHIVIDPDCPNVRIEAKKYVWKSDKRKKTILSEPIDAHNHSWDAIRYATEHLHGRNASPMESGGVIGD